jgi:hypothetical protein
MSHTTVHWPDSGSCWRILSSLLFYYLSPSFSSISSPSFPWIGSDYLSQLLLTIVANHLVSLSRIIYHILCPTLRRGSKHQQEKTRKEINVEMCGAGFTEGTSRTRRVGPTQKLDHRTALRLISLSCWRSLPRLGIGHSTSATATTQWREPH